MRDKIGLAEEQEGDATLVRDLMTRMTENKADFTLTFRRLCEVADQDASEDERVSSLFEKASAFDEWAVRWRRRLSDESRPVALRQASMRSVNPAFIPRNHLIEEVIVAAVEDNDLAPFRQLAQVLHSPFTDQPGMERFAAPPTPEEVVEETFCGT
jgi:uncharacterized protein YdiU (UPF0061 family)